MRILPILSTLLPIRYVYFVEAALCLPESHEETQLGTVDPQQDVFVFTFPQPRGSTGRRASQPRGYWLYR